LARVAHPAERLFLPLPSRTISTISASRDAFASVRPSATVSELLDRMTRLAHIWLTARQVQEAVARARAAPREVMVTIEIADEVAGRLSKFATLTSPGAATAEIVVALTELIPIDRVLHG
jgi:hypothetical protein